MKFTELELSGLILIEPDVHKDTRGFFYESYREDIFSSHGINAHFVQDNHSCSEKGVLRGLHFQAKPHAQTKLMRVIKGEVFDVVLDIRRNSNTFGKHVTIHLSEENRKMLFVPAGFAHGFCVLKNGTEFLYKVTDFYSPNDERGVIWNDPDLQINWPALDVPYILSEKDKKFPKLSEVHGLF